jgi:hypothetical protein
MLRRIYINNYRSLVNFEVKLNKLNLFLGANGAGKSAVFEALRSLRDFILLDKKVLSVFTAEDCCRWLDTEIQTFEFDWGSSDDEMYSYRLVVLHHKNEGKAKVQEESLKHAGQLLMFFKEGRLRLYRDDYSEGPQIPFDWTRSGVASIYPGEKNEKLINFREQLKKIMITRIVPSGFEEFAPNNNTDFTLLPDARNFVSWYRQISEDQGVLSDAQDVLNETLPGFQNFLFQNSGDKKRLSTRWKIDKKQYTFSLMELSDGQRVLICLYVLLTVAKSQGYVLLLDEPENYLALPEVQPWLLELRDGCDETEMQAVLISHHPGVIDYVLSIPRGFWLSRPDNLGTRIQPIDHEKDSGLSVSELVGLGWLHD